MASMPYIRIEGPLSDDPRSFLLIVTSLTSGDSHTLTALFSLRPEPRVTTGVSREGKLRPVKKLGDPERERLGEESNG